MTTPSPVVSGGAITEHPQGTLLQCRVIPSSSKSGIAEIADEAVKIKVAAPPVDGKANKAVAALLSKICKIPKSGVTILKGESGKQKRILMSGITATDAARRLKEAI